MSNPTFGFIGLGDMGRWMAFHLASKRTSEAERVVAVDADPDRLSGLAGPGLAVTTDRGATAGARVLLTCLPDGDVVESVLFGPDGVAAGLGDGAVVVDLSTIAYGKSLEIGKALAAQGKKYIDAPVSGAPAGAKAGTLTIMCGGDAETFEAVRPLLERLGKIVLHMGPTGSGQLAKTLNNVIYDINIAALAEVLPVAIAMGLDPRNVADIVMTGTSRSYASEHFVPRMMERVFEGGYPLAKAYKDLISMSDVAARNSFPMPVTAAATLVYQNALRHGLGDMDKGAMVLPVEDLLKVRFVPKTTA